MSPVSLAAGLHLGLSLHNLGIQECTGRSPKIHAAFPHTCRLDRGRLHPGGAPDHGVAIDEAAAARFLYQSGYLSVAQLEDGALWNW